jgi:hypothetical protein
MAVTLKRRSASCGAAVLLVFTGAGVAVAQPPPGEVEPDQDPVPVVAPVPAPEAVHKNWTDDPYAPHVTDGALLSFGTIVGPLQIDQRKYTGLGPVIAVGRRIGRFTFSAEYDFLALQQPDTSSVMLGRAQSLAAVGRVDVVRLGPHIVGENSMLAIYAEGAIEHTAYHYYAPGLSEAPRAVPADNGQDLAVFGFGTLLDHRLMHPRGLSRIGWQFGWRLASTPRDQHDAMLQCSGCLAASQGPMMSRTYDTALLVSSTLYITW